MVDVLEELKVLKAKLAAERAACLAAEAKRIDVLFDIERAINGRPAEERLKIRKGKEHALDDRTRSLDA